MRFSIYLAGHQSLIGPDGEQLPVFEIDETGKILSQHIKPGLRFTKGPPLSFDVGSYRRVFVSLSRRIPFETIGYVTEKGRVYPEPVDVMGELRRRLAQLYEHLDNTSASLETTLLLLEKQQTPADHAGRNKICQEARAFLDLHYREDGEEDEEDDETDSHH